MRYQRMQSQRPKGHREQSDSSQQVLKGDWSQPIQEPGSDRTNGRVGFVLLTRALLSAALCAIFVVILKIYQDKGNFSRTHKNVLNTVTIALSLALSINFIGSFKGLANAVRWRFLGDRPRDEGRVELILGLESFWNVFKLMLASRAAPVTALLCATWLLFGLAAQVFLAILGLTFESVDGVNYNGTFLVPSQNVQMAKIDCYWHQISGTSGQSWECPNVDPAIDPRKQETLQTIAHSFGDAFSSIDIGFYNTTDDIINSKYQYQYYLKSTQEDYYHFRRRFPTNTTEYAFRFSEYNPADRQKVYPTLTNRIITASSGECLEYNQTTTDQVPDLNGNIDGSFKYGYTNGTFNGSISIQQQSSADSGTTYVYRGTNIPQNETDWSCGPRCIWMWARRAWDPDQPAPMFYQCPITIGTVSNATAPEHEMSDGLARVAAASIGLQGRRSHNTIWTQYVLYPFGHTWSMQFQPNQQAGSNMAEYAIRSIASMATHNPTVNITGDMPMLGTHLEVKWYFAGPLLGCIALVHFLLATSAIVFTRQTRIPSGSLRSEAMVLQPLAQQEQVDGGEQVDQGNVHRTENEGRAQRWMFGRE